MMRRKNLALTLGLTVFAGILGISTPGTAQPNLDEVEIEILELEPGLAMLVGVGGNLGVSYGEDGVLLIDDQYAPLTEKIQKAVATLSEEPIRFVVNTHWHGDHTGGNENLGKAGAVIVAHDNVRERMSTEQFIEAFGMKVEPSPKIALPVVTFADAVTFHLNGEVIHTFHLPPAHTDGDSVIHFQNANVVHMGDIFFHQMYPFIDTSSGGGVDGVIAAVEKVLAMTGPETRFIPGHGPLANRDDLAAYLKMLQDCRDAVLAQITAGKTVDEAIAAKPNAAHDEKLGGGFINPEAWVRILYSSLAE